MLSLTTVIAVFVISSIAATLALLLTVADYFFAAYGPCEITINNDRKLTVQGGQSLLSTLIAEKIFIPSACGGRGTCGLCKLQATAGAAAVLPTEEPFLTAEEIESNVRLACQVKIRNDLEIAIPPELLAVREYTCRCTKIIDLTHDIKQFRFELLQPQTIDYIPGQYVQLLTPVYEKGGEEVYRAYSMSGDPAHKNEIETIIRLVPGGICTTYCFQYLKPGDQVKLNGPYGDFRLSETDAPIVFIAGGSGMAPIKCFLHQMKNTNSARKATYFFGVNTVGDIFMTDLMKSFESDLPRFTFVPVVANPQPGENWHGEIGLVTQTVEKQLEEPDRCEAYLCGSPGMIDAAVKLLNKLGVDNNRIFYDKFQ